MDIFFRKIVEGVEYIRKKMDKFKQIMRIVESLNDFVIQTCLYIFFFGAPSWLKKLKVKR